MRTAALIRKQPISLPGPSAVEKLPPAVNLDRLVALASPDLGRRIVEAARLAAATHRLINPGDAGEPEIRP